jgi:hypothetical protein
MLKSSHFHQHFTQSSANMSAADFDADTRGFEGLSIFPKLLNRETKIITDEVRGYERDRDGGSRSPRGADSRARSASPNGRDRGDTRSVATIDSRWANTDMVQRTIQARRRGIAEPRNQLVRHWHPSSFERAGSDRTVREVWWR